MVNKERLQKSLRGKLEKRQASPSNTQNTEPPSPKSSQSTKATRSAQPSAKKPVTAEVVTAQKPSSFVDELQHKIAKIQDAESASPAKETLSTADIAKSMLPENNIQATKKKNAKVQRPKPAKKRKEKKIRDTINKPISYYIPLIAWYSLALLIVLFDQMTKILAYEELIGKAPLKLTSWLQFDLVLNPGAAFSLFANAGGWQKPFLVIISLAVSILLIVWLARLPPFLKLLPLALTLILGGAVGNLIDRATTGEVVDFISIHYQALFFPSFNIADAAISCGAVLLFVDIIVSSRAKEQKQQPYVVDESPAPLVVDRQLTADELITQADAKKAASTR